MTSKASELVVRARTDLVLDHPFFASLALRLKLVETDMVETMGVDGKTLYFNSKFTVGLSRAELLGVICHEVLHCSNGHVWRRDAREKRKWNVACDFAINPILLDAGFELPSVRLLEPGFHGMSAEEIYSKLPDTPTGEASAKFGGDGKDSSASIVDGKWTNGMGEILDPADCTTAAEDHAQWQLATQQALQAAKMMGNLPASLQRMVSEILKPRVDWKSVLRRFVQQTANQDYTWAIPSTRYLPLGIYMPAMRSESVPPIVVAVDTSGSIGQRELDLFSAELNSIIMEVKPEYTQVVYCDARVQKTQKVECGEWVQLEPLGGGGTNFCPVFDWVENEGESPACLIYLTDMYGTFPDTIPEYPVLWAVVGRELAAPFGEVVKIEEEF